MPGSLGLSIGDVTGIQELACCLCPAGQPVPSLSLECSLHPCGSAASLPPPTLVFRERSCPVACDLAVWCGVAGGGPALCDGLVEGYGAGLLMTSCVRSYRPGAGLGQGCRRLQILSESPLSSAVQRFSLSPAYCPACLYPFSWQVSPGRVGPACTLLEGSSARANRLPRAPASAGCCLRHRAPYLRAVLWSTLLNVYLPQGTGHCG